jgi:hypothetical protein
MRDIDWKSNPNPFGTNGCDQHYLIQVGELTGCLRCGMTGVDNASPFFGVVPLPKDKPTGPDPNPSRRQRRPGVPDPRREAVKP